MTTLAEDYLNGTGGSVQEYHKYLAGGQRIGQAFYNAMSVVDQRKVNGTLFDPFYASGTPYEVQTKVYETIEFLLDEEGPHFVLREVPGSPYPDRTACGCKKGVDHEAEKVAI